MQNLSLYVLSLLTIIPHPISTFQLGSRYLACYIINMHRNCLKNSCRSGSASPTNPAPLLLAFANLLTKDHIKYGVTGSVRVRVSINIILFVLHFIDLYSLDDATVVSTDPQIVLCDRSMFAVLHNQPMLALTTDPSITQRDRSIASHKSVIRAQQLHHILPFQAATLTCTGPQGCTGTSGVA